MEQSRTDAASRIIKASPEIIYGAFLDPEATAAWRPPAGMRCHIYSFDGREGGGYRMAFEYEEASHPTAGKTAAHADVFTGKFVELVPGKRIVESVQFESDNPAFVIQ